MNENKIYKVYFSNDGTKPIIIIDRGTNNDPKIKNGQKTLSLKLGYHCRYMVKNGGK